MLDIRDSQIIRRLVSDIESTESKTRRENEIKAYKCAEGAQKEYVIQKLSQLFPKSYNTMRVSDVSLSKKVLDKLAAYTSQPIRKISTPELSQALSDIYTEGNFQDSLQEFDRDFNRQKYGLLWVRRREERFSLDSLKGFESFVVINKDTNELECVILNYPGSYLTSTGFGDSDGVNQLISESQDDSSAQSKVYVLWTKDFHTVWRVESEATGIGSVTYVTQEGNEEGVNPLGAIPFVWKSKNSSADLPYLNNITEQSIETNILMSDLLTSSSNQGHGQLVIKRHPETKLSHVHSGQSTAIELPLIEGSDVQNDAFYINANPDLGGMKDTVSSYIQAILSEHGINGSAGLSGESESFSSGIERMIAQADVQNQIRQNQSTYSKLEQEAFEIIKKYLEVEGGNFFGEEELTIIFEKPKVMISDKETLENIEKRLSLGLITKIEALQMLDPNLDDNAAKERLDLINEEKRGILDGFSSRSNERNKIEVESSEVEFEKES